MKQNLILLTVLLTALSAFSTEYYVDASRPDDSGAATNWATAKQTIQAAVDMATDGDTVLVTNGVYSAGGAVAPGYETSWGSVVVNTLSNRVYITKAIIIRSMSGPEVTVIQGDEATRCAYLMSGALMEGFTLTGGHAVSGYSGSIFVNGGWVDQIGWYDGRGGGACMFPNAVLNRCILSGNFADNAGGVFCESGGTINDCLVTGNCAEADGGVALYSGVLNNCTITKNLATGDRGIGGAMVYRSTLNNCIVWGNTGISMNEIESMESIIRTTCSSPLPEGDGNICADPMFKNPRSNFRLRAGSPCVDAGSNTYSPATDLDGVARPVDGDNNGSAIADMGCYELSSASLPKIHYVDASRPDDSGAATNWATAKQTIQAAVDVATDEDTVLVTNGVYSAGGMVAPAYSYTEVDKLTNRVCLSKAIAVRSVNGAAVTAIQGASDNGTLGPAAVRCVYSLGAVLEGFTLTGGYTLPDGGFFNSSGGGAFLITNAVLNNCVLSGNSARNGGGVFFLGGGGTLNNCLLNSNTAQSYGGGAVCERGGRMNNCIISENIAMTGGGVFMPMGEMLINNCSVWGNNGNNIEAWGSATIRYTCSSPLPDGEGNICADPLFVDAMNGKFQLQASSPCINAGNNSYVLTTNDLAGNPRIAANVVDMGAYEFFGAQDDYDSDGISDEWETRYFGNINKADVSAICSNGINTIREAYIAGLDPTNAAARFKVEKYKADARNTLRWNATSGRVYSVYFSTNLLNGFQLVETNIPWTAGAFTDTVHSAQGQGYYKIGVELK